jgi:hypothetical protein
MDINLYYLVPLVACCAYALMFGGPPERIGIAVVAANAVLSFILVSGPSIRFRGIEFGVFTVDVLAFIFFVLLALRANRFWTIWVSALLGLGVVGHLARWAGPDVIPWAYALVLELWSYPILVIIALGTFNRQRRMRRLGEDRSWSSFSGRSASSPPAPPRND